MGFGIGSLISPKVALKMVKVSIENTIKQKVEKFDMIYKHDLKVIDFRLYNVTIEKEYHDKIVMKYDDEGGKFCSIIRGLIDEHLKDMEINFAVISYPSALVKIAVIKDGEKLLKEIQL